MDQGHLRDDSASRLSTPINTPIAYMTTQPNGNDGSSVPWPENPASDPKSGYKRPRTRGRMRPLQVTKATSMNGQEFRTRK